MKGNAAYLLPSNYYQKLSAHNRLGNTFSAVGRLPTDPKNRDASNFDPDLFPQKVETIQKDRGYPHPDPQSFESIREVTGPTHKLAALFFIKFTMVFRLNPSNQNKIPNQNFFENFFPVNPATCATRSAANFSFGNWFRDMQAASVLRLWSNPFLKGGPMQEVTKILIFKDKRKGLTLGPIEINARTPRELRRKTIAVKTTFGLGKWCQTVPVKKGARSCI